MAYLTNKVSSPSYIYILPERDSKTIVIQDINRDDLNVTGGEDYLIAYRVYFQGKAPKDGTKPLVVIEILEEEQIKV